MLIRLALRIKLTSKSRTERFITATETPRSVEADVGAVVLVWFSRLLWESAVESPNYL